VSADDPTIRHRARELALQWLYQWEIGALDLDEVFVPGRQVELHPADAERDGLAETLVRGTAGEIARIDQLIADHASNWRLERLAVVDRLVLRLAIHELLSHPDTPPAVVIDEALELARAFSTEQAVSFVNGVLDAVRRTLQEK
jgi:N utilization substance protein B